MNGPGLRRGVRQRVIDAVQCLVANGRLALGLALAGALVQWGFGRLMGERLALKVAGVGVLYLLASATFLVPCVAVNVILAARARGKELEPAQCLRLVTARLGRATWVLFASVLAAAVVLRGWTGESLVHTLILLALALVLVTVGSIALAVASMGSEEEPGEPVSRAVRLFAHAPLQAMKSTLGAGLALYVLAFVPGLVCAAIGDLPLMVIWNVVAVVIPIHGALLYFELRRATDPGALAFAPREIAGGPDVPCDDAIAGETSAGMWAVLAVMAYCTYPIINLIRDYAVGFGFGYGAAMSYLLAVPLTWLATRSMFRRAAHDVMRVIGPEPGPGNWVVGLISAWFWLGLCGFSFTFICTFLTGVISYFMTPAPSLMMELWMDVTNALAAAIPAALVCCFFAPLLCRRAPRRV